MPFLQGMPRKGQPPRAAPDDVVAMLLLPPRRAPRRHAGPGSLDRYLGIDVPPQRRAELLAAFATIGREIQRFAAWI